MNQEKLNTLNTEVMDSIQQYVSGLMTISELCDFMANVKIRMGAVSGLSNLLDPNTGLRYPTMQDTDAAVQRMEIRGWSEAEKADEWTVFSRDRKLYWSDSTGRWTQKDSATKFAFSSEAHLAANRILKYDMTQQLSVLKA